MSLCTCYINVLDYSSGGLVYHPKVGLFEAGLRKPRVGVKFKCTHESLNSTYSIFFFNTI